MFPGYHWCVAMLSTPLGPSLVLGRILTFTIFIGCVALFASLTKHKRYRSLYTLALLPILFPYVALLYTDIPGLFLVLLGAVLARRKLHILAASVLVCACLVRQSNVMWLVFIAGWTVLDIARDQRNSTVSKLQFGRLAKAALPIVWPYGIALVATVIGFHHGALASDIEENRPQPNIGNVYLLGFVALALWAPVAWKMRSDLRHRARTALIERRPRTLAIAASFLIGSIFLIVTYDNRHSWNNMGWFIHNWPLMAMQRYLLLRIVGIPTALMGLALLAHIAWTCSRRDLVIWLFVLTCLFLFPHALAEHRYFIVPLAFLMVLYELPADLERRLVLWFAVIDFNLAALMITGKAFP